MIGNHPPRWSGFGSAAPDRPFRDDRQQKARARQAAEALFAPKPPPASVDEPPLDPPARQSQILKPAPATRPLTEGAATRGGAGDNSAAVRRPHPGLAEIRHDGRAGRGRLPGSHTRDQTPPRQTLRGGSGGPPTQPTSQASDTGGAGSAETTSSTTVAVNARRSSRPEKRP